jgi:3-phosphoshikimate 1-carboxyvinyltransferase
VTPQRTSPGAVRALHGPLRDLPDPLPLPRAESSAGAYRIAAEIRVPGSKSLANRAILLAALAEGCSTLRGVPAGADDVEVMLAAVERLGAQVERSGTTLRVRGVGGCWRVGPRGAVLDLHNAGTATRFLAAGALCSPGALTIDGDARMRQRPIGELGSALRALGCGVEYLGADGSVPVRITPPGTPHKAGAVIELPSMASSQFISALLLVAPWLGGLTIRVRGEVTSSSYVAMTLALLADLGAQVRASDDLRVLRVTPTQGHGLRAFEYEVEPDASAATYWWAGGAVLPGARVQVPGLVAGSLQGDARFPDLLARMGCTVTRTEKPPGVGVIGPAKLTPIQADMSDMPDAALTLAAVASLAKGTSVLRGLRTLRVKESDRVEALRTELGRLGVRVEPGPESDSIAITPPPDGLRDDPVEIETYNDHRVAMSMAVIALRRGGISVRNPACVGKTYPGFWADYARLVEAVGPGNTGGGKARRRADRR